MKFLLSGEREPEGVNSQTGREVYFDYLRVFATFAIIILHVSAQNWFSSKVNGFEWQVFNFYNSIVRWAVSVFVMISGSLFLSREISLKKLYSKYILRMLISFGGWSTVYAIFMEGTVFNRMAALVRGHYHMWFIPMIIGIYMCIPVIKPIVGSDNRIKYYLILALLFAFVIPESIVLINDFGSELLIKGTVAVSDSVDHMNMHIILGFMSYFVLGYYMNKIDLSKRQRTAIYVIGILGFVFTIVMGMVVAFRGQVYDENYHDSFSVNVLFESLAVFTWFKYKKYNRKKWNLYMQKLSKYSFGAYLVHALVLEQLNIRIGLNTMSFNTVFSVVSIGMIVFVLSFGISAVLNRIPVIKKYMV